MKIVTACLGVAVLLSASVVSGGSPAKEGNFDPGKYFSSHCAGCHGIKGRGNPRAAAKLKADLAEMDLQGAVANGKTDQELSGIILNGSGKMPAFGKKLGEKQAVELAGYIRKMAGGTAEKRAEVMAMPDGAKLFTARSCVNCHGKDGKGVAKVAKMLKADASAMDLTGGEARGKTDAELATIITGGAAGGKMPAYDGKMTKEEIEALVSYIRGINGKK